MTFANMMIVGLGGFIGSVARFAAVRSIDQRINSLVPYGTLIVNIVGSLILGIIVGFFMRKTGLSDQWKLFLGTGFCGGFTTFSAFAWENVNLISSKMLPLSLFYISISLILGLLAVVFGIWLSRFL
ncbi:fluoride efflux transporter CrcB [Pseudochryseolinea flava]|uniref:Fluoride-specific ion channel FluC n=1 Tax=Pseudochryseolinea flava TaxID=2059302 RepID=A0A364XUE6_9BACT|nr:fluoride efflux transporter CrcB [Pseudochryseolinea flava]RAV97745.1 fluoride efflux transporter CrcB [Pseudochryseolinea flava]